MNSDPRDSAVWRCFGMLDSEEASAFDETMRDDPDLKNACREIESISAAVAAVTTVPVIPRSGQLGRLQTRLGINAPRKTNWVGISGWAAAAVLTFLLILTRLPERSGAAIALKSPSSTAIREEKRPYAKNVTGSENDSAEKVSFPNAESVIPPHETSGLLAASGDPEPQPIIKSETRRLIQEIDVLREKLESLQQRDQRRFAPVPGMALTTIVRMTVPGAAPSPPAAIIAPSAEPSMTAMLGDALTKARNDGNEDAVSSRVEGPSGPPADATFLAGNPNRDFRSSGTFPALDTRPSAVPIYDASRDEGTLVVNNFTAADPNMSYNLWVKTDAGDGPIYVGKLPKSDFHSADSFDFSLGSVGIVPTAFILTKGVEETPAAPSAENTVLQGP